MIRQVDDIMVSAALASNRKAVLDDIASRVTFKILPAPTLMCYAMDIEKTALYIKVHATSYNTSCPTKLGWDTTLKESAVLIPMPPSTVKDMARPRDLLTLVDCWL
jgi:hypothetical protein